MANKLVRNVPVVMQMEATECGAACLCMILAYYGRWEPLDVVRAACGVSRDGSKAANILRAARSYGLEAKGFTYSMKAILKAKEEMFPSIIFWNFNHYVVLNGFKGKYAYINDPARGSIRVLMDEFDRSFTGIVLRMKPTEAFEKKGSQKSDVKFIVERLKGMAAPLLFVSIATAILQILNITNSSVSTVFLDRVMSGSNPEWLIPVLIILSSIVVIQLGINIASAVYFNRIRGKFAVVSSSKFMWHMLNLPVGFFAQRMSGDLQQRQESNESIASVLIDQLAPTLLNLVFLVLYLVVMLSYSWKLTLLGVATAVINTFVANHISKTRINISRQQTRDRGIFYSTTIAGIESIETIKASGAEGGFFERWAGYQALTNDDNVRFAKVNLYLGAVPTAMLQLANVAVLLLGTYLIMNGEFTAGMLLGFQGFMGNFMGPVQSLIGLGQQVLEMRTYMERVQDVLDYPRDPLMRDVELEDDLHKLRGKIEVRNLSYGYSSLAAPIIKDFSVTVQPGAWVALVGASGSGKSTIAKLISGLYQPWEGEVLFDDKPLAEISNARLRGSLAVVDQDIVTFEDSVSANIRMWDKSIEEFEVIMAARDADIHDDIMKRDNAYHERILPGGRNYSGGQLQRLEISRVLAQDPTIIIMDEATSALDASTEARVINAIRLRGITCVVVAHRLSTIRDCDEILVLDEGVVVERGTHDELMAKDGAYARLVRNG